MLEHIARSIQGVWRLAKLDAGGAQQIDNTLEGFWRSFIAAIILLPAFFLLVSMDEPPPGLTEPSTFRAIAVESIGYVVKWTAFPLAAIPMIAGLGRNDRYFGFIAALNWAQVIEMVPALVLIFLSQTVLPPEVTGTLQFMLLAVFVLYEWYIAKTMLDVPGLAAAGLIFVSFAIWFFLMIMIQMLTYGGQVPIPS